MLWFMFVNAIALPQNYRIQHYTTIDGLVQNNVESIYKDSRGFLWFGTWYGLSRFDGYNFVTYVEGDGPKDISDGFINDITEDKNGDLWIATRNGINKLDFSKDRFIHFTTDSTSEQQTLSDSWINTLFFDNDDNLWIGTEAGGVNCISFNEALTQIKAVRKIPIDFLDPHGISSGNIFSMLQTNDGYIYIGTIYGLDRLDPKTGEVFKFQNKSNPYFFNATIVHSLFEDKDNTLWIGTEDGLIRLDEDAEELKYYEVDKYRKRGFDNKTLHHGLVKSLDQDGNGTLVIGTLGGLHLFDKKKEEFILLPVNEESEFSLNNKFINKVYCDKTGNIWVGTAKGGVNKFNINQKAFNALSIDTSDPEDIGNSIINSVAEDGNKLWIGTAGKGLFWLDQADQKLYNFTHNPQQKNSLSSNYITSIQVSPNQKHMWLGTWGRGLNKAQIVTDGKISFKTLMYDPPKPYGAPNIYVSSLVYDRQGYLWVGTSEGLFLLDKGKNTFFPVGKPKQYGQKVTEIGTLFIDKKDNLWIGTTNGLHRFRIDSLSEGPERAQPDSIYSYRNKKHDKTSLSGNFIVTIYQDYSEQLWFSVYGEGIDKLEALSNDGLDAEFTHFTVADGLSNGVIYSILEDKDSCLWLSSDKGLTKIDSKRNNFTRYYKSDGLRSDQFYWSAGCKSADGTLFFGSTKGLIYFNPDSITLNMHKPSIVITDFKLFNKTVPVADTANSILTRAISETEEIKLNYDENFISFEFAALSYYSPEDNQYEYRLEGFEDQWVPCPANRRFVSYTNLRPGKYTFMVRGSNNDGLWCDTPAKIRLIITPPWWKTELFAICSFALIAWLIWLIIAVRNRNLQQKKIILEHLVKQRTKALDEKSRALEDQKKQLNASNKELSRSNETKDTLFAIIAHDLKSPFNTILSVSELLYENYDELDETSVKKMLKSVYRSSNNFYMLLENLLEWTRVQRDSLSVNCKRVNLEEIIKNNILVFEDQSDEKGILIKYDLHTSPFIYADEHLLNTIFRNLISNAIKFTAEGDVHITVSTMDKNFVVVQIKDSGMGMSPEQQENLFYVKEVTSTRGTHGEKGTGLGLIVCKEFIEICGGRIWVKSLPRKGTSFFFTIPVKHIC